MGTLGEKNLHGKYPKSLCIKIFRMFHVTDRWFNDQVNFKLFKKRLLSTVF